MEKNKLKNVAIRLCELQDIDPYEKIPHGHPKGFAVCIHSPAWKLKVGAIEQHLQIQQALEEIENAE